MGSRIRRIINREKIKMERQREKSEEIPKETKEKAEKELEELRKELSNLRKLKNEKEQLEKEAAQKHIINEEDLKIADLSYIEEEFDKLENILNTQEGDIDSKIYRKHAEQIETELQELEEEIIGEKGLIEKKLTAYDELLTAYPWLQEERKKFMYTMPDRSKQKNDYISWKNEWAKVLFDYARFAILHIIYIRELNAQKPFSDFTNREQYVIEIAEELISQKQAKWLSKKKEKLRVYWKTLEVWSDEIYRWAYDNGKIEPIMIYELRDAKHEDFSNLPLEDLEAIFKILVKNRRGKVLKLDNGQLAFKIKLE
jgi:DNA repair exonuclease SbcCD ATPase subunit